MAGLLDKFKKGGGGFLNNVDGIITGYAFTTEIPGGGASTSEFNSLFLRLDVKQDGAEAVESTHLFAGSADDFVISDDGLSLEPVEGAALWGGTTFGRFYASLVNNGLEDVNIEDGDPITFEHIVGAKVRFVQVKDTQAIEKNQKDFKAGRRKGKLNAEGSTKGKDGKYYPPRSLEVSAVYSVGNDVDAAPAKKTAGKTTAKTAPKAAVAAKGKKAAEIDPDLKDLAQSVVVEVLEAAKGKSIKGSLNVVVTRRFQQPDLKEDTRRDAVRGLVADAAFLAAMAEDGLITVTGSGASQVLTLA